MRPGERPLRDRELRAIARAATEMGKPKVLDQVFRIRSARADALREHLRNVRFQIQTDAEVRHAEVRELFAQIKEDHAARAEARAQLKAEVAEFLAQYTTEAREMHEEWQRQLAAIERARREPVLQKDFRDV